MTETENPTSPTLTDLIQESSNKSALIRLATFKDMMTKARAFIIMQEKEGTITKEEAEDTIRAYGHIEHGIIEEDGSFCCGDCGKGSLHIFSNDDGQCAWCVEGEMETLSEVVA
jgi:hypothetical protein